MGMKQKAFGDLFEELFFLSCQRVQGMAISRFPDGCKVVGGNKIIRVKTMCDWILTYGGVTALIDTKTTADDSFPFSKIEPHQVDEMLRHSQSGAKSGYVIWLRKSDDVLFCSSLMLSGLLGQRGSIRSPHNGGSHFLGKSEMFRPKMIFGIN